MCTVSGASPAHWPQQHRRPQQSTGQATRIGRHAAYCTGRRDPRTRGPFGAAWLLGHVVQPARAGAEAVSVMSLRGDADVLDETSDGRLLRSPTFFVLEQLARLKPLQSVTVSNAEHVVALASACDDQTGWLIANLTAQVVDLTVGGGVPVRIMNAVAWHAMPAAGLLHHGRNSVWAMRVPCNWMHSPSPSPSPLREESCARPGRGSGKCGFAPVTTNATLPYSCAKPDPQKCFLTSTRWLCLFAPPNFAA